MQRFLSAADAARILEVTPATVRLMHRRGTLAAAAETEGGIQLYLRPDVEKLAQERESTKRGKTP